VSEKSSLSSDAHCSAEAIALTTALSIVCNEQISTSRISTNNGCDLTKVIASVCTSKFLIAGYIRLNVVDLSDRGSSVN